MFVLLILLFFALSKKGIIWLSSSLSFFALIILIVSVFILEVLSYIPIGNLECREAAEDTGAK